MLRTILRKRTTAIAAAAAVVAMSGALPSPALGDPTAGSTSSRGFVTPTRAVAQVRDASNDVVTKSGSMDDIDGSLDGFKAGKGTVVPSTAADEAIDLAKVTYRIVRTGSHPSLKITYRAHGPFHYIHRRTAANGAATVTWDVDGVETLLGGGRYVLDAVPGHHKDLNGLFRNNAKLKHIACGGLHIAMKAGTSTATQMVPLSCLTKLGLSGSKLRSAANHLVMTVSVSTAPTTGSESTTVIDQSATVATDTTEPTPRLPFTR